MNDWKLIGLVAGIWVFAAWVNSWDAPDRFSPRWYRRIYKICHYLVAQATRAKILKEVPRISTGTVIEKESPFRKER